MEIPEGGARRFVPVFQATLDELHDAAQSCRGCPLYRDATQAVLGRGTAGARVVMVGEQPGDVEDREGEPFVGPAGRLLDKAVHDAGFDPGAVYFTNAVKHFKFRRTEGSQRRLHEKPTVAEIEACKPWLIAEFGRLSPQLVVVLGASAARSLLGPSFRVTRTRGVVLPGRDVISDLDAFGGTQWHVLASIHPSAVLRADDRDAAYEGFVNDLRAGVKFLK